MKAIIYARKSSDEPESVEAQIRAARAFCDEKGWPVVQVLQDVDISGQEFVNRPGFTSLMEAATAKKRDFDVLVIRDVDRFGREMIWSLKCLQMIIQRGVRVWKFGGDKREIVMRDFKDKMMLAIETGGADDYAMKVGENTRGALHQRALEGKCTGTRVFGYDIRRAGMPAGSHGPERCIKPEGMKKCPCFAIYAVNEVERAIVNRVFALSASGMGNRRIAEVLGAEGVRAPGWKSDAKPGRGWAKRIVRTMLSNKLYIGEIVYGRTEPLRLDGAKKRQVVKDESKWTVAKNAALAIIAPAMWSQVQKRRDATRERFGSHRNTDGRLNGRPEAGLIAAHLLNGFLVCGVCGGSLSFMSKNGRVKSYYCQRRVSRGRHTCTNSKGVNELALNQAIIEALHEVVADPEVAWALITERTERWKRERSLTVDARADLVREEKRLEAVIERLLDNLEAGDDVGLRLKKRREELDALRVRLAEPEDLDVDQAEFERALAANVERLRWIGPTIKVDDVAQTRAAMRALGVQKITVTPTETGWTFQGDGSLAGMAGVLGAPRRPPRPPTYIKESGSWRPMCWFTARIRAVGSGNQ